MFEAAAAMVEISFRPHRPQLHHESDKSQSRRPKPPRELMAQHDHRIGQCICQKDQPQIVPSDMV